jgi:hypothetical protein
MAIGGRMVHVWTKSLGPERQARATSYVAEVASLLQPAQAESLCYWECG